jgi:LmbE family N-acetylglucosaminyl deacetylase
MTKMKEEIEFIRLVGNERRVGPTLASVSRHWQGEKECFAFVSPHDDDVVLGGGLMIQLAKRENVPVHIMIVTDGSMGYCSLEEKDTIVEIRKAETFACYESLGIPRQNIHWLGFPDCQLNSYRGRRVAKKGEPAEVEGFNGLQNGFTYFLRKIRPTQVFLPTSNDLHPDHRIVHEELLISLFHSAGDIWPELGKTLERVPYVHELGVYCDFPESPRLRVRTPEIILEKKLAAIGKFVSQKQIASLIDIVRKGGPEEYLRALEFKLYEPSRYRAYFDEKEPRPFIH